MKMPHDAPGLPPDLDRALDAGDPADRAALERAWQEAGRLERAEPDDETLRAWGADVWSRLERQTAAAPDRPPLRLLRFRPARMIAVAAAVVLLAAVGVRWWMQPATVAAPRGGTLAVTLPDGSRAHLNAGSSLEYHRRFAGARREVRLRGEAFFEVEHGARPFVVRTFNAEVTVLGTRFNVRAWPEEAGPRTEVMLASGRVRLAARDGGAPVVLAPGQSSTVASGARAPAPPAAARAGEALAWRENGFVLVGRPLSTVLAEIERRYDVEVRVEKPAMLADTLSVVFTRPADVESVLRDIGQFLGYRFRTAEGGYLLEQTAGP